MKELRCLLFSNNELVSAIIDRRRRVKEPIPEGTVRDVKFEIGDRLETTLEIEDDYGADRSFKVTETEVAAALVHYCLNRKIPLPVNAEKFVQVMSGSAALMISMNFTNPMRNAVGKAVDTREPAVKAAQAKPRKAVTSRPA